MTGLATVVAVAVAAAAPPTLDVTFSPARPTVGDRVAATVLLSVDHELPAASPAFPVWADSWGVAEVAAVGPVTRHDDGDRLRFIQEIELVLFETGEILLPPLTVLVPTADATLEVATPGEASIEVVSVLPEGEEAVEAKPPTPPRPQPVGAAFWWTGATLTSLCLALGLLLARRRLRGGEAVAARADPATELELTLSRLGRETDAGRLHTGLSQALRRFLGRSLALPLPESSTREVRRLLAATELPPALAQRAVGLLRECDQVKFARREDSLAQGRRRLEDAAAIAGRVERILAEPEESEAA